MVDGSEKARFAKLSLRQKPGPRAGLLLIQGYAAMNKLPLPKIIHSFKKGDKVRFTDDVMRRFPSGFVVKCHKDGHVEVEISVFSRLTPFTVWQHQLEPA